MCGMGKHLRASLDRNIGKLCPDGFDIKLATDYGYDLILHSKTHLTGQHLLKFLLSIAALADNTMPLNRITVQGHCALSVSMWRLRAMWPEETRCLGGAADLEAEVRSLGEYKLLREAVLQELSSGSLFLLSREGIYCDVHLSIRADPPCTAPSMIGKAVGHLLGDEAHDRLTKSIGVALRDGQGGTITYPGLINMEQRFYTARLTPIQELDRVLTIVQRVS